MDKPPSESQPHLLTIRSCEWGTKLPDRGSDSVPVNEEHIQIGKELGHGGMATVYFARHERRKTDVAVKIPELTDDKAPARFILEAEVWPFLIHPNIVRAYDVLFGPKTDQLPVVLMEYCPGGTVGSLIYADQDLPLPDALDIAIQICWAMEYAHECDFGDGHIGLLHCDLKSSNVLIGSTGEAKVSDFGLSRCVSYTDIQSFNTDQNAVTGEDTFHEKVTGGTPAYMPPEQWTDKVNKASDIYSFGVMLYEMCCRRLPFVAESVDEFRHLHCDATPPDPCQLNSQLPKDLAQLILKCLAKCPDDRPQGFRPIAEHLNEFYHVVTGNNYRDRRSKPEPHKAGFDLVEEVLPQVVFLAVLSCGSMEYELECDESIRRRYLRAATILESHGLKIGLGEIYGNLAELANRQGNVAKRKHYLLKSAQAFQTGIDTYGRDGLRKCSQLICDMGNHAAEADDFHEANELFNKALEIAQQLGSKEDMGRILFNMGGLAVKRGAISSAERLYEQALQLFQDIKHEEGFQKTLSAKRRLERRKKR